MMGQKVSVLLVFWVLCTLHSLESNWTFGRPLRKYKSRGNSFMKSIKRNLFFVNEAQVSLNKDVITVSTNGYNEQCKGKDSAEFRETYVKTGVTKV